MSWLIGLEHLFGLEGDQGRGVSGQVVYEMARVTQVDLHATALLLNDAVIIGSGSVTTSGTGRSSVSTVR